MLRTLALRSAVAAAPRVAAPVARAQIRAIQTAVPKLDHHEHHHAEVDPPLKKTKDGAFIVWNTAFSLEWVLQSPPPLHAFLEPPIIVEWPEGEEGHH